MKGYYNQHFPLLSKAYLDYIDCFKHSLLGSEKLVDEVHDAGKEASMFSRNGGLVQDTYGYMQNKSD